MISFHLACATGILARLCGFEPGFVAARGVSSDSWLFRLLGRFADVFSPIAEPFGDLLTKLAICRPKVNHCRFYRAVVDFFGSGLIYSGI
jgi:hypothetical protein